MGKTVKIGLVFSYEPKWIAGSYYVLNILELLLLVPSSERPEVTIISSKEDFQYVDNNRFFFVKHFEPKKSHTIGVYKRLINKISRVFLNKNVFRLKYFYNTLKLSEVNAIYPIMSNIDHLRPHLSNKISIINWIPDFQEKYLPELFSDQDLLQRQQFQTGISETNNKVVFSSKSALDDYNKFFPNNKTDNYIFRFSVFHPNISAINKDVLFQKYNLPNKYFFIPNQFWQHKNHIIVVEALCQIKDVIPDCIIVFSGNEYDYRSKDYVQSIKELVHSSGLRDRALFLGFIPREDQLFILKEAQAVIQPSKFEGWSTVIEDCKAQSQFVIASDLNVHKEQSEKNICFFDPNNVSELASIMVSIWEKDMLKKQFDYNKQLEQSTRELLAILQS